MGVFQALSPPDIREFENFITIGLPPTSWFPNRRNSGHFKTEL